MKALEKYHTSLNELALYTMLGSVLFYAPFIFVDKINQYLRITWFILCIIFLLSKKIIINKKIINLIIVTFLFLFLELFLINYDNIIDIRNAISFFLTIVFTVALVIYSSDQSRLNSLLRGYKIIFIIIPVFTIMSYLFYLLFDQWNLLNLKIGVNPTIYLYTPFGIMVNTSDFPRATSYFEEPQIAGLFFALNSVFFLFNNKIGYKFTVINIIAGFLTKSFLFYGIIFGIIFIKIIESKKINNIVRLMAIAIILITIIFIIDADILSNSSLDERLIRIRLYTDLVQDFSLQEILLGFGFNPNSLGIFSISSGEFILLHQFGVVGFILINIFVILIIGKNPYIIYAALFAIFSFHAYYYPIFWVSLVLFSAANDRLVAVELQALKSKHQL